MPTPGVDSRLITRVIGCASQVCQQSCLRVRSCDATLHPAHHCSPRDERRAASYLGGPEKEVQDLAFHALIQRRRVVEGQNVLKNVRPAVHVQILYLFSIDSLEYIHVFLPGLCEGR